MSNLKVNTINDASGGSSAVLYGVASPPNSMGFRNRIINGGMGIWQRGTSGFTTLGNYSADRWFVNAGTSLSAVSRSTDVPAGFQFSISVAGTNVPQAVQRIESLNCFDLVGQSVTISFWAKQTSGAGSNSLFLQLLNPNATDNYAAITQIGSNAFFTGTSGWVQYSTTFNNLPAGVANGLQVIIGANTAGASTFYITGVQLEAGTVATPFERRDYGRELQMCQRYFWKTYSQNVAPATVTNDGSIAMMANTSGFAVGASIFFPVEMRSAPTITYYSPVSGASGNWRRAAGAADIGVANYVAPSTRSLSVYNPGAGTNGEGIYGHVTAAIEL